MPVTRNHSTARATMTFSVHGAERNTPILLADAYTYQGQKIYPVRFTAEWTREDGEDWVLASVQVHGNVQTKKGVQGGQSAMRRAYTWRKVWADDTPDWLSAAVLASTPA